MKKVKKIITTGYGMIVLKFLLEEELGKKIHFKNPSKMKKYILSRYAVIERNGQFFLSKRQGVRIVVYPRSLFVSYSTGEYHGFYRGCESSALNCAGLKRLRKYYYAKYRKLKLEIAKKHLINKN